MAPFWPKTVQNGAFWSKMPKNGGFSHFSRNPFFTFSETLQLIRAFNSEKHVPTAFLKKSRFAHFGQKLSKIGHLAGCVDVSL